MQIKIFGQVVLLLVKQAIIKGNRNYRKFLLRGIEKVEIEVGLLVLLHNLSKIVAETYFKPIIFKAPIWGFGGKKKGTKKSLFHYYAISYFA